MRSVTQHYHFYTSLAKRLSAALLVLSIVDIDAGIVLRLVYRKRLLKQIFELRTIRIAAEQPTILSQRERQHDFQTSSRLYRALLFKESLREQSIGAAGQW